MLIKINPERYISLERVQDIEFFKTSDGEGTDVVGFVITLEDGSRISFAGAEATERLRFFLDEVFVGSVIDLESLYGKKDEILAAKQIMKDKMAEIKAQAEAAQPIAPANAIQLPGFTPGNRIVRSSDGKALKNLFVMPPRGGGKGGPTNGGTAA